MSRIEFQKKMDRTIAYVTKAHEGQYRKSSDLPYVVHPIQVMLLLDHWGVTDQDVLAAALAHDVMEDCGVTAEALAAEIGEAPARLVGELTFVPDPNSTLPVPMQKNDYVKTFLGKSVRALVVKIADRICNTRDFLRGEDPSYSAKYWKKADPLLEAAAERRLEIMTHFGRGPARRVAAEILETSLAVLPYSG